MYIYIYIYIYTLYTSLIQTQLHVSTFFQVCIHILHLSLFIYIYTYDKGHPTPVPKKHIFFIGINPSSNGRLMALGFPDYTHSTVDGFKILHQLKTVVNIPCVLAGWWFGIFFDFSIGNNHHPK